MPVTRREALQTLAVAGAAAVVPEPLLAASAHQPILRHADPGTRFITPGKPVLGMVHLTPGPWLEAMELKREYLRSLDPDRLLFHFRKVAGIPSDASEYGGWEMEWRELRGHSIGHFLTATSRLYRLTDDRVLGDHCAYIVRQLRHCQQMIGTGYVSAFPDEYLDRVESMERVWAPYYTLHKILAGLLDAYAFRGDQIALDTAHDLAAYLHARIEPLGPHFQGVLDATEQGGMNELFWNMYAETGDDLFRRLARAFYQNSYFNPLWERRDELKGRHCNSFIPNVVGVAREYELTGDITRRQIAEFFWKQVVAARSFVTGGTSNSEHWNTDPYHMQTEIGPSAHESCCSYNMLKLTDQLWNWSGDVAYQEYMDRALFNAILPTINRETGMSMYYVSMAPGYYKTWDTPESSFWCCTGTGMENFVRIVDYIYGAHEGRVYVNQFVSSRLSYQDHGFSIVQDTTIPDGDDASIRIEAREPLPLKLAVRIPAWSGSDYGAAINGTSIDARPAPGSYLLIDRVWQDGDRVDLSFKPRFWHSLLPVTNEHVAFGHGPVVLAARLGEAQVDEELRHRYGPYDGEPVDVPPIPFDPHDPGRGIEAVHVGERHFRVAARSGRHLHLVPLHRIHTEHFAAYLPVAPHGDSPLAR